MPEEHVAQFRCNFRRWGKTSCQVILPIASVSTVALSLAGIKTCGNGAIAGQAYTDAMDAFRTLEAKVALRKQSDYGFVPGRMHEELSRLHAIEKIADKQLPVRATAASQTAEEEAKRFTTEAADIQANLTAAHKEAATFAAEIFGRIAILKTDFKRCCQRRQLATQEASRKKESVEAAQAVAVLQQKGEKDHILAETDKLLGLS